MDLAELELWRRWDDALEHFDAGDRGPLSDLLREGVDIPEYCRAPLAEIIAGVRRPKRGKGKLLVTPEARRVISRYQLPYYALKLSLESGPYSAAELGYTRAEHRANLQDLRARGIEAAARATGLSTETVRREWVRQLKSHARRQELYRLKRLAAKNQLW